MDRKLLLLLTNCLLIVATLPAQITVTNAYFPAPGDTLKTSFDALPAIDLGTNGENEWDFTSLAGITSETIIRAASEGDYFANFSAAEAMVGYGDNTGELYYDITDNAYKLMGYVGPDPANFGLNVIAELNPHGIERRAPLNFFDVNSIEHDITVAFSTELLPTEITDSLIFAPDSLRIRIATERLDVVDAWGTLSIPGGTYEVLREKRTEERETKMDVFVGVGPFGEWIDVTDALGLDFLGKDTTITYNFFSNEAKEAIAVVTVDNETEDPITVQYKSNEISTSTNYVDQGTADMFAYPNPAVTEVRFDFINLPVDTYTLKIYNILGVEVFRQNYIINDRRTIKLDISSMQKGTYLYSLVDNKGKPITTKRLVVIKP